MKAKSSSPQERFAVAGRRNALICACRCDLTQDQSLNQLMAKNAAWAVRKAEQMEFQSGNPDEQARRKTRKGCHGQFSRVSEVPVKRLLNLYRNSVLLIPHQSAVSISINQFDRLEQVALSCALA
ncbi:hypothetical protein AB1L42_03245 [Thalassoglobus sp. JC818]|uniref:hypothetical protein n=1 Tax=Thalassoglobus sp. JC818 TaxID=3232136 RepID=UPI003457C0FC